MKTRQKNNKKYFIIAGSLIVIWLVNYTFLQSKMTAVIDEDYRNEGIQVSVHYQYFINPTILIYDLKNIPSTKSKADIFRVFLQFADKTQNQNFDHVYLSFRGKTKFFLEGTDFKIIGKEYEWQNPVYTMRTFSEKLYTPSGLSAFSSWEGGVLGVAIKQMEEFNQFHDEWYLNNMIE